MIRVLQAMAGAEYGGAEAFFVRLVSALHAAGLHQHVVTRPHEARLAQLQEAGLRPVTAPFGGRLDISTRLALRREIKRFKPDLVLTWMNRATSFCPRGRFVHVARLGGYYDLKYYRHCDHLIGNTADICRHIVQGGWPAERVHHLPNFAAETLMEPLDRRQYYTPLQAPLLLALGRLHKNKAFDVLFEAVARLPDVYVWLAGEGPERAALQDQAQRLGIKPRVRFLGWRDDVPALYAACDMFVCPSRVEPLGNTVLEAWAQARPVVAANAAGRASLIEHERTGLLVPMDDPRALADAIKRLVKAPALADALAGQGRAAFEQGFTEASVVDAYIRFFEAVSQGGPAGTAVQAPDPAAAGPAWDDATDGPPPAGGAADLEPDPDPDPDPDSGR